MSNNNDANLVRMTNQIATNLGNGRDEEAAATAICRHLETFWARSMKQRLVASLALEGVEFSPLARRAATLLATRLSEQQASR